MNVTFNPFFSEAVPQLVTPAGQATSIGIWVLMAIIAGAFAIWGYNQVISIMVNRKHLAAPTQIFPQPLITAMEKEFIGRPEYERRHSDIENQIKETRKYAHDEVHAIRGTLQSMQTAGETRDVTLHRLEERSQAHMRQIDQCNIKLDRLGDRVADKVEKLIDRRLGNGN